jgi:hypothetical protein
MQQEKAEASFKRKQMLARDASQAMVDYAAEQAATREKTARLKKARLAKEATEAKAAAEAPPKAKAGKKKG